MKKIIMLFTFMLTMFVSNASADITISDAKYRWDVLNEPIKITDNVITLENFIDQVERQTGYRVINKVDELDMKKRYVDLGKLKTLGAMFDTILEGYDAVVQVNDKKHRINIIYPEHIYIDLPYGWNLIETKKDLERQYPYIRFYIAGNRLSAYGLPEDLAKITPFLRNYLENAYKKYMAYIKVYPYCTKNSSNMFIGKRKYMGSEQYKPIQTIKTTIRHGDKINVSFNHMNVNFTVDLQNDEIIYDDVNIPLHKLNSVGFVFKLDKNPDDNPGWLRLFNGNTFENHECNDVIIVIDISANSLIM